MFVKFCISYYDPRTLYSGSAEPLSLAKPPRNLLRTGWGPRGDSGPERDRVRATQPANFQFSLSSLSPTTKPASAFALTTCPTIKRESESVAIVTA